MLWLSFTYSWKLDSKSLRKGGIALDALYAVSTSGLQRGSEVAGLRAETWNQRTLV